MAINAVITLNVSAENLVRRLQAAMASAMALQLDEEIAALDPGRNFTRWRQAT